jgi:hypothetical protein
MLIVPTSGIAIPPFENLEFVKVCWWYVTKPKLTMILSEASWLPMVSPPVFHSLFSPVLPF